MGEKKSYERIDFTDSVNAAKEGNMEAFQFLYNQSIRFLSAYVRTRVDDTQDLDDILQEIYIKIFKDLHSIKEPKAFMGWAKTIAHNAVEDYRKAKMRHVGLDISMPTTSEEEQQGFDTFAMDETLRDYNPEAYMDAETTKTLLMEILDSLPFMQRSCILLQMEQKTTKEIAAELEIPEGTVKSNLNYARQKIKEKCLELEKKGTKLYGLAPIPFFIWLLRLYNENYLAPMPEAGSPASFEAIAQKAPEIFGNINPGTQGVSQVANDVSQANNSTSQASNLPPVESLGETGQTVSNVAEKVLKTASTASKGAAGTSVVIKVAAVIGVMGVIAGGSYGVTSMIVNNASSTSHEEREIEEEGVNEDSAQASTVPIDSEDAKYEELYEEVLSRYEEFFEEDTTLDNIKYRSWVSKEAVSSVREDNATLCYSFFDINNDGTKELLIFTTNEAAKEGESVGYNKVYALWTTDGESCYYDSGYITLEDDVQDYFIYENGYLLFSTNRLGDVGDVICLLEKNKTHSTYICGYSYEPSENPSAPYFDGRNWHTKEEFESYLEGNKEITELTITGILAKNENQHEVSSAETEIATDDGVVAQNGVYDDVIAEYRDFFENGLYSYNLGREEDYDSFMDDYEYIAWESIKRVFTEPVYEVNLDYSLYDINHDGIDELLIFNQHVSDSEVFSEICDLFTSDGTQVYHKTEDFYQRIAVYDDGTVTYSLGNFGDMDTTVTMYEIDSDGYTLNYLHSFGVNTTTHPNSPYFIDNNWYSEYPAEEVNQLYTGRAIIQTFPSSGEIYHLPQ